MNLVPRFNALRSNDIMTYVIMYASLAQITVCIVCSGQAIIITLNVRGPIYLDLTKSISWLLMPWLLHRQVISSHDIEYVKLIGPCFISGRHSITGVFSVRRNYIICSYIFIFPLENLARKGLSNAGLLLTPPLGTITKSHVRGFFDTDLHEVSWHFATHEAVRPSGF